MKLMKPKKKSIADRVYHYYVWWWWLIIASMFEFNAKIQYDACSFSRSSNSYWMHDVYTLCACIRSIVWMCVCVLFTCIGFVMKQRAKQWRLNKFKSRFSFRLFLSHTHPLSYARTHWNELSRLSFSRILSTHTGKSRIYEQVFIDFFLCLSLPTLCAEFRWFYFFSVDFLHQWFPILSFTSWHNFRNLIN